MNQAIVWDIIDLTHERRESSVAGMPGITQESFAAVRCVVWKTVERDAKKRERLKLSWREQRFRQRWRRELTILPKRVNQAGEIVCEEDKWHPGRLYHSLRLRYRTLQKHLDSQMKDT